MPRALIDEFTARRDLSRQRKYQLRAERDGLCRICGRKRDPDVRSCPACLEDRRARHRCTKAYKPADYI